MEGLVSSVSVTVEIVVNAIVDAPLLTAEMDSMSEDTYSTLKVYPDLVDKDSEYIWVRITLPSAGGALVGLLNATASGSITFEEETPGVYIVNVTAAAGSTPEARETALDNFLDSEVTFTPRAHWSGKLTGTNGIKVEAFSEEIMEGLESNGTECYVPSVGLPVPDRSGMDSIGMDNRKGRASSTKIRTNDRRARAGSTETYACVVERGTCA